MNIKTWIAALGLVMTTLFSATALANTQDRMTPTSAVVSVININTADVDTLSSLPGIGPKKAESIVAYRELNGNFQSVNELSNVKGIGKRMVETLASKVSI